MLIVMCHFSPLLFIFHKEEGAVQFHVKQAAKDPISPLCEKLCQRNYHFLFE